ncbi:MAG: hypoxanthine phosphoribosyltransferase [Clostridiaceae bacterium]|nr:hypoxanthine phosphoribosyltransferase [Clostridiaceae bacterium]
MQSDHEIIFTEAQIKNRIIELGQQITQEYKESKHPLSIIAMIKGSTYFLADLTRAIDLPLNFDFIAINKFSSQSHSIQITKDIDIDIKDHDVIVVEEIIRSGLTTHYMIEHIEKYEPASLKLAALLANPDQLMINLPLAYTGFEIDYTRVVGYGMDYKENYRNFRYIAKI